MQTCSSAEVDLNLRESIIGNIILFLQVCSSLHLSLYREIHCTEPLQLLAEIFTVHSA